MTFLTITFNVFCILHLFIFHIFFFCQKQFFFRLTTFYVSYILLLLCCIDSHIHHVICFLNFLHRKYKQPGTSPFLRLAASTRHVHILCYTARRDTLKTATALSMQRGDSAYSSREPRSPGAPRDTTPSHTWDLNTHGGGGGSLTLRANTATPNTLFLDVC